MRVAAPGAAVLATGYLLAGGGERMPAGAEGLQAVAAGGAGAAVTCEGIQRVARKRRHPGNRLDHGSSPGPRSMPAAARRAHVACGPSRRAGLTPTMHR